MTHFRSTLYGRSLIHTICEIYDLHCMVDVRSTFCQILDLLYTTHFRSTLYGRSYIYTLCQKLDLH